MAPGVSAPSPPTSQHEGTPPPVISICNSWAWMRRRLQWKREKRTVEKSQRVRRRQRYIIKGFLFSTPDKSGSFWPLKWQNKQPGWLISVDMVTWLPGLMEEGLERQEGKEAPVLWGITTLGRWRMVLIQKRTPFFQLVVLRLKKLRFIILQVLEVKTLS